jgi:hypothetical protein
MYDAGSCDIETAPQELTEQPVWKHWQRMIQDTGP